MNVGRIEMSWTGNCLAIALAQGFVEPLEATALHVVQATLESFVDHYADYADGRFTPKHHDAFNANIAARLKGIRDYIVAHYRLARRADIAYWRDAKPRPAVRQPQGDHDLRVHRRRSPRRDREAGHRPLLRPAVLGLPAGGYGVFPEVRADGPVMPDFADLLARCGSNFPDHAAALAKLRANP